MYTLVALRAPAKALVRAILNILLAQNRRNGGNREEVGWLVLISVPRVASCQPQGLASAVESADQIVQGTF